MSRRFVCSLQAMHTLLTALFSGRDRAPPKLIVATLGRLLFLCWVATQSRPEMLFERVGKRHDDDDNENTHMSDIAPELSVRG